MPLIWRLLIRNYFQVLFICIFGFISVFLITRTQEITRIATLNSNLGKICLFTLFQIPYILPIAIPISGLISAILLFQRLSHTKELTAFRTSGIGLKTLGAPLLMSAFLLSVVNFSIVSEITPRCRHLSHNLIQSATTVNPLFLIKNKMIKLHNAYIDMKMIHPGREAKNIVFAVKKSSNDLISLMTAKKIIVDDNLMTGSQVTIISNIAEDTDLFDSLIIENQETISTSTSDILDFMEKNTHKLRMEHLPMTTLIHTFSDPNTKIKTIKLAKFEFCRRLFFPSITFAFTLLGFSLGMHIGQRQKKRGIYLAILLSGLTFICSIAAKSFQVSQHKVIFFYSLPVLIIFFTSYRFQKQILEGIE